MAIQTYTSAAAATQALAAALASGPAELVFDGPVIYLSTGPDAAARALTPADQAAQALASGLAVTSTGTPSISGTYACDSNAQSRLTQVMSYISSFGAFPKSVSSLPWLLADGTTVVAIPSITVFKSVAQAIADYAYAVDEFANGAPGASLPSANVTIA